MTREMRNDLTPQGYIRQMFRETKDGKLSIPFNRRSSADMIQRARRYERLLSMHAPEVVVTEEGRCLAEAMVLYYAGKEEPIVWD